MRFNKTGLALLASNPATKFEKEGLLIITERQEGFFRRADGKKGNVAILVNFSQKCKKCKMKQVSRFLGQRL